MSTATNPPITDPTAVAVVLIPAVSIDRSGDAGQLPNELPRTGFPAGWVAGIGIFALLLGLYFVAVRKRWTDA